MAEHVGRTTSWHWADRLAGIGWSVVVGTVAVTSGLGLAAAIVGERLTDLGSGPGGLWGVPDLFFLAALLLGTPAMIWGLRAAIRRQGSAARMLVGASALLVNLVYFVVPHLLDPCLLGLVPSNSTIGPVAVCERFGDEVNVHTRFHLAWHALPAVPVAVLCLLGLRRWYPAPIAGRRVHR